MAWIMKFLKSFYYAAGGIGKAFLRERNLRIHFAAANIVCAFAVSYGLEKTEWVCLILTIAAVFAAELMNTAVEAAVDTACEEYTKTAGLAKDAAAGAVLVTAAGAVAVGIFLFGDASRIAQTFRAIAENRTWVFLFLILLIADAVLVFTPTKK